MTNEQLYLISGVPSVVALLGILLNLTLYNAFSNTVNARMATIESRMQNLENTFTTRFDLLIGRMTELEKKLHRRG